MKKYLGGSYTAAAAVLAALIGFILRQAQLKSGKLTALIAVSIIFCAGFLALALTRKPRRKYTDVLGRCLADLLLTTLGAIVLIAGCAVGAIGGTGASRYISALGALAALVLLRALMLRCENQPVGAGYYVPMILFYVARLFYDFRRWTIDPAIADYCFMLFAVICFMLATYFAAGFCFDRGNRRALAFFSMAGVYFGGVSMAGGGWETALTYGGSSLMLLAYVWQTARLKLRKRRPRTSETKEENAE